MANKHLFERLDKNGDGLITKEEFRAAMVEFGMKAEQMTDAMVDAFFKEIDVSHR